METFLPSHINAVHVPARWAGQICQRGLAAVQTRSGLWAIALVRMDHSLPAGKKITIERRFGRQTYGKRSEANGAACRAAMENMLI